MADLVVRGGLVVDGTGADARRADVAVADGVITAVGRVDERGAREIDADGLVVTPGFVDVHTHYDGQATWDPLLTPSSWHGVTTAVMGNCGVGFAPARPGDDAHRWLIGLMEGVEDIPGTALHEGIEWAWESFPQYLDALSRTPRVMDVATHVPHGAVRAYVMGERGAHNEPANADDIAQMARIVTCGISAGALGFSMSRTIAHRAIDGEPVPGTFAATDEIFGIAGVLGEMGTGVVELAPAGVVGEDLAAPAHELAWMLELARATKRPVSFALVQHDADPGAWRVMLDACADARRQGVPIYPQIHTRSPAILMSLDTKFNPFARCPSWARVRDRAHLLTDASLRTDLVREADERRAEIEVGYVRFERCFVLGDPPDYEPDPSSSCAAEAARRGCSVFAVLMEWLCRANGAEMCMIPLFNWSDERHDVIAEMLSSECSVLGLGDGGAHTASICDASTPTHVLTHWVRDRKGARMPLEAMVRKMTLDTATLYGLGDRGVLAPGMRADVNVIDHAAMTMRRPELLRDLPAGAPRLVQRADGYVATICAGEVTFEHGEPTGALPGRVVRGMR
jgi:N-acyl-D-amino-acid deacylase